MRAQGAIVVDGLSTGIDLLGFMPTLRVNSYELQPSVDSYLRRRGSGSPVKTFAELYHSGKWLKGGMLETRFHETMKAGNLETNVEYQSRLANQRMIRDLLVGVMERVGVDALLYPMKPLAAPKAGSADDGPRDNSISAVAGLPAIVVPAGLDAEGLPLSTRNAGPAVQRNRIATARPGLRTGEPPSGAAEINAGAAGREDSVLVNAIALAAQAGSAGICPRACRHRRRSSNLRRS